MQVESKPNRAKLLWIALILIVVGGLLAHLVNTDGGNVKVRDVRFMGTNGTLMSALLYIPNGVTAKTAAPAPSFVSMDILTRASSRPASLSSYHGAATSSSPLTRLAMVIQTRRLSLTPSADSTV